MAEAKSGGKKGRRKGKILLILILLLIIVMVFTIKVFHYTSEPEFCGLCHSNKIPGPNGEVYTWEQSSHAKAGVTCLDCHAKPGLINYFIRKILAIKDPIIQLTHPEREIVMKLAHPSKDAAPMESCLFCHTDDFNREYRASHFMALPWKFLKFRNLDYVVNPQFRIAHSLVDIYKTDRVRGYNFSHKEHMENFEDLECISCHFKEFAHPNPNVNYPYKMKMVCFNCHEKEGGPENSDCETCHAIQPEIRKGSVDKVKGEEDVMSDLECKECHTTFKKLPDEKSCIECHDDEEYGKIFSQWKKEITSKIEELKPLYEEARKKALSNKELMERFREGEELYRAVIYDGSEGAHNFEYEKELLKKAQEIFKEIAGR